MMPSPQLLYAGTRLHSPPSSRTSGRPCARASASHAAMSMPAIAMPLKPDAPSRRNVRCSLASSSSGATASPLRNSDRFCSSCTTGFSASGV